MEAQKHTLEITIQERYFTLGTLSPETPAIWIVCHGYGQLAQYFIRNFQVLADAGHYIIAPEGLSKFYLEGFSGRVGASWMTREERETAIRNYVHYISKIYEEKVKGHSAPLNLLGFSQGVATISRWALLAEPPFHQLVLWAGVFPDDLPLKVSSSWLESKKISLVVGNEDPFLTEEKKNEQMNVFRQLNIFPNLIQYSGKHEINQYVLKTHFTS